MYEKLGGLMYIFKGTILIKFGHKFGQYFLKYIIRIITTNCLYKIGNKSALKVRYLFELK